MIRIQAFQLVAMIATTLHLALLGHASVAFGPATTLAAGSHECLSGECSCSTIGYPSWCCPGETACAFDDAGHIACCSLGNQCTGVVSYPAGYGFGCDSCDSNQNHGDPGTIWTTTAVNPVATVQVGSDGSTNIYIQPDLSNSNVNTVDNSAQGTCRFTVRSWGIMTVNALWLMGLL